MTKFRLSNFAFDVTRIGGQKFEKVSTMTISCSGFRTLNFGGRERDMTPERLLWLLPSVGEMLSP